jgi:F-type H+-transporting ATPase subunit c
MDPIAAKYLAAGLACVGIGLSGVGVGLIYASFEQSSQKDRANLGIFLTSGFGIGCFALALLMLFVL